MAWTDGAWREIIAPAARLGSRRRGKVANEACDRASRRGPSEVVDLNLIAAIAGEHRQSLSLPDSLGHDLTPAQIDHGPDDGVILAVLDEGLVDL